MKHPGAAGRSVIISRPSHSGAGGRPDEWWASCCRLVIDATAGLARAYSLSTHFQPSFSLLTTTGFEILVSPPEPSSDAFNSPTT